MALREGWGGLVPGFEEGGGSSGGERAPPARAGCPPHRRHFARLAQFLQPQLQRHSLFAEGGCEGSHSIAAGDRAVRGAANTRQ